MTIVSCRDGFTLIEVIITTIVLGVIASVATLALRRMSPPPADAMSMIADSIPSVMRNGRAMTLTFLVDGKPVSATIRPDGSVIADTVLHVDRLSGGGRDAR